MKSTNKSKSLKEVLNETADEMGWNDDVKIKVLSDFIEQEVAFG